MNTLFYMQEQRLYRFSDGRSEPVTCQAVEQYIGNLKQIHRKKEWKTQGSGADFMGIRQEGLDLSDIHIDTTGLIGMALIISGVLVINLFSQTGH